MESVKIEKRTYFIWAAIFVFLALIYRISTNPKIICRIDCSTCSGGYIEQDFTQEAHALKGRNAYVWSKDQKELIFNNCYALKKHFFSNRFDRYYDLNWERLF